MGLEGQAVVVCASVSAEVEFRLVLGDGALAEGFEQVPEVALDVVDGVRRDAGFCAAVDIQQSDRLFIHPIGMNEKQSGPLIYETGLLGKQLSSVLTSVQVRIPYRFESSLGELPWFGGGAQITVAAVPLWGAEDGRLLCLRALLNACPGAFLTFFDARKRFLAHTPSFDPRLLVGNPKNPT